MRESSHFRRSAEISERADAPKFVLGDWRPEAATGNRANWSYVMAMIERPSRSDFRLCVLARGDKRI